MSLFKDQVALDIGATFLNAQEFADEHEINDVKLICVVDRSSNDEREKLYNYERPSAYANGVYAEHVNLYVSHAELGYKPEEGNLLELDNQNYIVQSCEEEMGMLIISLEGNRS